MKAGSLMPATTAPSADPRSWATGGRYFLASLRHGIRVETPTEFLAALKARLS